MFRVFAAPGLLSAHQAVILLRLKRLPFKVYCSNITSSLFFSIFYRAKNPFCTLTPSGKSIIPIWQLAEAIEEDEDIEASVCIDKATMTYSKLIVQQTRGQSEWIKSITLQEPQRMRLDRRTQPNLHLACWCTVLYSCWWLTKVGGMYRYIRNNGRHSLYLCLRYCWLAPIRALSAPLEAYLAGAMRQVQSMAGVSEASAQFYEEHFTRMCTALEEHFHSQPTHRFLLGTTFPTIADVTLSAAFATFFNFDNPPAEMVATRYPCLFAYTERMTGWKGGLIFGETKTSETVNNICDDYNNDNINTENSSDNKNSNNYYYDKRGNGIDEELELESDIDNVPETLTAFFEQVEEVFPFMISQCASLRAFINSNELLKLKKITLEEPWNNCTGYVLPTFTSIKSLMIIDDNIFTVRARSVDLELALYVANAVHEADEVFPETDVAIKNRENNDTNKMNSSNNNINSKEDNNNIDKDDLTLLPENEDKNIYLLDEVNSIDYDDFHSVLEDAERADFYRVHSGSSRLQKEQYKRSIVLQAHNAPSSLRTISAASNKLAERTSITEHLSILKRMLNEMRCPQYTLASVNYRSQSVVVIIPEHEACKARQAVAEQRKRRRVCYG